MVVGNFFLKLFWSSSKIGKTNLPLVTHDRALPPSLSMSLSLFFSLNNTERKDNVFFRLKVRYTVAPRVEDVDILEKKMIKFILLITTMSWYDTRTDSSIIVLTLRHVFLIKVTDTKHNQRLASRKHVTCCSTLLDCTRLFKLCTTIVW